MLIDKADRIIVQPVVCRAEIPQILLDRLRHFQNIFSFQKLHQTFQFHIDLVRHGRRASLIDSVKVIPR